MSKPESESMPHHRLVVAPLLARMKALSDGLGSRRLEYADAVRATSEWDELEEILIGLVPQDIEGVFAMVDSVTSEPLVAALKTESILKVARNVEAARMSLTVQAEVCQDAFLRLRRVVEALDEHSKILRAKTDALFAPLAAARDAKTAKARSAALAALEIRLFELSDSVGLQREAIDAETALVAKANDRSESFTAILGDLSDFVAGQAQKDRAEAVGRMH